MKVQIPIDIVFVNPATAFAEVFIENKIMMNSNVVF